MALHACDEKSIDVVTMRPSANCAGLGLQLGRYIEERAVKISMLSQKVFDDALVLFARGDLKRAMNEFNRDQDAEDDTESPETP